ncbi:hypothetical protein LTR95_014980 [Oleoguttula sp. CCFEE 5521]
MAIPLKQFVFVRRRSGMTMKEFFDHHYQVHGFLSYGPSPETMPLACDQTHIFDASYSNSILAQPSWSGHNDSAELYFTDHEHLGRVFQSDHTRNVIAPDAQKFNDFAAATAMMTFEEVIAGSEQEGDSQLLVTTWCVQASDPAEDHQSFAAKLNPEVAIAFKDISARVVANVAIPDEAGVLRYFKGRSAPSYTAAYQIFLADKGQITAFNKAKTDLEREVESLIVPETSFLVFGVRSVVFDRPRDIPFSITRQPQL